MPLIDLASPAPYAILLAALAAFCALQSHLAWRRAMKNQRPGSDVHNAPLEQRRRNLAGFFTEEGQAHLKASGSWGKLAMAGGAGALALLLLSEFM